MYILEKIKSNIVTAVNQALNDSIVKISDLATPPNPEMGDLSLPCFLLSKKTKKTPGGTAEWLISTVNFGEYIMAAKTAGPYVNFVLNKKRLLDDLLKEIWEQKEKYGQGSVGQNERVMIEFSNGNTHKEYHVGHLRNIIYGNAVNQILRVNGYDTIPVSYINDFGIHVAKTLWCYLEFYKDQKLPDNKGYALGQIYARSTKEIETHKTGKHMVELMMKKIESRQGEEYKLWEETREWSIDQFNNIYEELDIKFDHIFYESEFIERGKKFVKKLLEKGILEKSEGAVIADLTGFDLGVLVVLRSDGTALYTVADIPLALHKIEKFNLDRSIYVVDFRQSLYFKQLIKILELLGIQKDILHLSYNVVKLPSGMMSSRTGNVMSYEDLRNEMLNKTLEETKKRHPEWNEAQIQDVAKKIALGAIKFEMIKVGRDAVINFDINQALRFEGFTSAYLQYTLARINSIFRKFGDEADYGEMELNAAGENIKELKEYEVALLLAKYPEIIVKAGGQYEPSEIAKYLFSLAQSFNDYYHGTQILVDNKPVRNARLILISAVHQVLMNGLNLLGIDSMEEM